MSCIQFGKSQETKTKQNCRSRQPVTTYLLYTLTNREFYDMTMVTTYNSVWLWYYIQYLNIFGTSKQLNYYWNCVFRFLSPFFINVENTVQQQHDVTNCTYNLQVYGMYKKYKKLFIYCICSVWWCCLLFLDATFCFCHPLGYVGRIGWMYVFFLYYYLQFTLVVCTEFQ